MKIISSRDARNSASTASTKSKQKTLSLSAFSKMVDTEEPILESLFSASDDALSNISVLAEEIEKIGQELSEKPMPETFNRYKKHIRLLLKSVGNNMEIRETTGRVGMTGTRLFRTTQDIDSALSQLAQKILSDEKNRIDILQLTNHLQGLILNILT